MDLADGASTKDAPDTTGNEPAGRHALMAGAGILLSRLSGLLREMVLARVLGVGVATDAFRAAMKMPNLLQNLLGEGALSASFIPVHARLLEEGREEDAGRLAGAVAGFLSLVTGVLVVLGVVFAEPITRVLNLGWAADDSRTELATTLVRIVTPGLGFLVLSAWCLGILNSHRRFFLSYVAPVLWNAAQVAALVWAALMAWDHEDAAVALAWAVLVGGAVQFLVQLPTVRRLTPGLRPSLQRRVAGFSAVVRRAPGALAGRGVAQISAFVDLQLASFLALGALSALQYAQALYLLPLSLFGMSVAAAELPELSRLAGDDPTAADLRLRTGMRRVSFFTVFSAVALVAAGDLIVALLLEGGDFGASETIQVWLVLCGFAVGLPANATGRLWQNALFASGDTNGPAALAGVRLVIATAIGVPLMFQLDNVVIIDATVRGLDRLFAEPIAPLPDYVRNNEFLPLRLGAMGLTLGSSAAALVQTWLLARRCRRRLGVRANTWWPTLMMLPCAVASVGAIAAARWLVAGTTPFLSVPVVVGAGGLTYVAVGAFAGIPEARSLLAQPARILRRRR
ncbi:MAG: murein biosynthesis integral membrane protein MurJ [Actinomycetota bacterium]|nr:murein biosynthesis integral membrane protein MurJ [Actinomycetota bacterium]